MIVHTTVLKLSPPHTTIKNPLTYTQIQLITDPSIFLSVMCFPHDCSDINNSSSKVHRQSQKHEAWMLTVCSWCICDVTVTNLLWTFCNITHCLYLQQKKQQFQLCFDVLLRRKSFKKMPHSFLVRLGISVIQDAWNNFLGNNKMYFFKGLQSWYMDSHQKTRYTSSARRKREGGWNGARRWWKRKNGIRGRNKGQTQKKRKSRRSLTYQL